MCLDELAKDSRREQWRVSGQDQDVVGSAFEDRPRAANGVSGAAGLLLHCHFHPVEGRGVGGSDNDNEWIDSQLPEPAWDAVDHRFRDGLRALSADWQHEVDGARVEAT